MVLGIYGPCTPSAKIQFLHELRHLQSVVGENWLAGGDFNITRFSHERSNGSFYNPVIANFNDFIANACLLDLSPNNFSYTWSNFQEKEILVKLDRFLISPAWEAHYPTSVCIRKSRIVYDHIPICLNTKRPGWGHFPFRFYRS